MYKAGPETQPDESAKDRSDRKLNRKPPSQTHWTPPGGSFRAYHSNSNAISVGSNSQPWVPSVYGFKLPPGKSRGLGPSNFALGEVVWAPYVAPNLKGGPANRVAQDKIDWPGCPLSAKYRPHIVVTITKEYMIGVPMFSHDGQGTTNQTPFRAEEALYVTAVGTELGSDPLLALGGKECWKLDHQSSKAQLCILDERPPYCSSIHYPRNGRILSCWEAWNGFFESSNSGRMSAPTSTLTLRAFANFVKVIRSSSTT